MIEDELKKSSIDLFKMAVIMLIIVVLTPIGAVSSYNSFKCIAWIYDNVERMLFSIVPANIFYEVCVFIITVAIIIMLIVILLAIISFAASRIITIRKYKKYCE